jgi:hypothetical protein
LQFIKYTHDYPHAEGKELKVEESWILWSFCPLVDNFFISGIFWLDGFFFGFSVVFPWVMLSLIDDVGRSSLNFL